MSIHQQEMVCLAYEGREIGWFSRAEAAHLLATGKIDHTTWYWCEGMPAWRPVTETNILVNPRISAPTTEKAGASTATERHVVTGDSRPTLLISSVPKSGTYLVARFLDVLGASNSGLHLRNEFMWDFKDRSLDAIIRDPDQFKESVPLEQSLARVGRGEYFLAHLEYDPGVETLLLQFNVRHIFLYRKIRDVLVSHFRFICDPRRAKLPAWLDRDRSGSEQFAIYLQRAGLKYMEGIKLQSPWIQRASALKLNFESLMGDDGLDRQAYCLQMLGDAAGFNFSQSEHCRLFQNECLSAKTRTHSGERTRVSDLWSEEAERLFTESGGLSLEQIFG